MVDQSAGRALSNAEWDGLIARSASGALYGVRTTGIFCQPGCPARTPLRRNVVAFATTGEALAAGFRACKRCKPDLYCSEM